MWGKSAKQLETLLAYDLDIKNLEKRTCERNKTKLSGGKKSRLSGQTRKLRRSGSEHHSMECEIGKNHQWNYSDKHI